MTTMRMITGLFDNRDEAERTVQDLVASGAATLDQVEVHAAEPGVPDHHQGASLRTLPMPPEEHHIYAEGIRRGGFVVSADVDEAHVEAVTAVFHRHNAVDLEARQHEWRGHGWFGWQEAETDRFSTYGGDAVMGPRPDPDARPTRVR
ncbi:hypothetical protein M0638_11640 [Roseomonas sp. NAR14]|uniref:Heat induced stress protein YflT n=1 Tax=Roseomonas acroporae TaxID=2937791 RepID=A0A9X2BVH4_9PROT|nr:hypothetical protein [Roseomonas acroporae]MCK8785036.1 hypothetical protein [Roseomonas acroporae]